MTGLLMHAARHFNEVRNENIKELLFFGFGLYKEIRMQFITEGSSQCHRLDAEAPKPSYTHEEVDSHLSPKSSLPVKEMESLWSAWWSFILSPRQINSLMIDLEWTCMKKTFIYSWNLICPVLESEAFDKKWQNGKTQSSTKDRLFILLMPFSPSALQFYNKKNSY